MFALVRLTTLLWIVTVGLFTLTSYLDARSAGADILQIAQIYALGFLPWLIAAPLTVHVGLNQARRRSGWPRLALETMVLAAAIAAIVLANMAFVVSAYWGVTPGQILAANSFREWIWDILIFAVALLAGHVLGALRRPLDSGPLEAEAGKIVVRSALRVDIVDIDDVIAATAQGNYVALVTESGEFLHRATLGEMKALLARHGFVQVHRSHLVRADAIVSVRRGSGRAQNVLMPGGREFPVSASGKQVLEQLLNVQHAAARQSEVLRNPAQ
ncbi:MAG: LytTR family DNA-binding domain-containing protein [Parasphingopyxis sp.]|uniref:LytTR family DNA-binding domain-containing protein n=1 Tax=Parasphingopyxis sp. TaxID=1920299 RepID=UPI003F9FBE87